MRRTPHIHHLGRLTAAIAVVLALLLLGDTTAGGAAPDEVASFEASNVPNQYIRHRNALGEISRIDSALDRADATWILRPALNGKDGAVSFESVNYPGTYLRHQSFRIKQHRNDGSQIFRDDASFYVRAGLNGRDTKSFEATNVPGQYIRHRNFELWISATDGSQLFKDDASFRQKPGLDGQVALDVPRHFESVNLPGRYIRHRSALGEITPVGSDLDMKDATWVLRPALSGTPGAVSFESTNYPGTFLRHQAFRIKQHRNDNSDLFKKDASFIVRPGLSGLPGTVSFQAVNAPGPDYFIRHQNGQLWIAGRGAGNAATFAADATFRQGGPGFRVADKVRSFEAVNVKDHFLRHRLALGELTPVDPRSNLDRADATWIVRPALSGTPGAVSFESANYPGTFLRHQAFRIKQQRDDGSDSHLFRLDTSFYARAGLAGQGTSFEAVNVSGHFIRHQNYQFWVANNDGSDLFKRDASFHERDRLFVEPGECTRFFRRWRTGIDDDSTFGTCAWVMGINQYCAARDATAMPVWDGNRRYLVCQPNWRESTFLEELETLARGTVEQFMEAANVVAPFVRMAVAGVACVKGAIFACATLALDIAELAGAQPPDVAREALAAAEQVGKCVDGNIVACAQLGARGARAGGVRIPSADAAEVAENGQKCYREDFAACVGLGLMAADAAGVPVGLGVGDVADAMDCGSGDTDACVSLAKRAVQAGTGVPLGGVANGAENARKCANGDNDACIQLGKAMVEAARR